MAKKCAARDETITALQRANHRYNRTAAGRLAGELREGEPCPVCGSYMVLRGSRHLCSNTACGHSENAVSEE